MSKHFQREIDKLKKGILTLSAMAEESVQKAVSSLTKRDTRLANDVIENDFEINEKEVELEEDCMKILSLHQPVAIDLRFVGAVLKINNELERIGDLAVNIAERAVFLSKHEKVNIPMDFTGMTKEVQSMLKGSLDSLVNMDAKQARYVLISDDKVDAMNREMFIQIQNEIRRNLPQLESLIHLLSASRHLERIADHATNIAEDVIYMIEGEIIRHKTEEYQPVITHPKKTGSTGIGVVISIPKSSI